ncbi:hypothetical protein FH972_025081 [Carpinus fangiana]|uniref:Uncharacterized protein n=1 Tax=Carpinus fangiana TaxID=176857 RepID=A0A5N6L0I9_9ROSI|nr:hypothetical protein FH972_025081 [Carpinus fangiana]
MPPHAETRSAPHAAAPNHDEERSAEGYESVKEDLNEVEYSPDDDENNDDGEEEEEEEEEEGAEDEDEENEREAHVGLTEDGNSVVDISIGPMQRQLSSSRTTPLEKARALQKSATRVPTISRDLPGSDRSSLRDRREGAPTLLSDQPQELKSHPFWSFNDATTGAKSRNGRARADSESGLKRYLQRLNLPSMPNGAGFQKFMDKHSGSHSFSWLTSGIEESASRDMAPISTDESAHWATREGNNHLATSVSYNQKDLRTQEQLREAKPPAATGSQTPEPEKPLRPTYLRRTTSDGTLLHRAHSTASSLGDDNRWTNVHEQVNVRFKAIKDSFADSAANSMKLPKLPDLSSLSFSSLNLPGMKSKETIQSQVTDIRGGVPSPNGHLMSPPEGITKKHASTHPYFAKAVKRMHGDLVILGGYRGSVLRQAEPPHRQCWVPIKVGLNIRKVNLEVGLDASSDERMPETIIPGGMLANIGPIDISRRLFKRLRSSTNAKSGSLRVWDYGYDWRLNPLLLSQQLIEFLEGLPCNSPSTPPEKRGATVVAHSLGGLITRHAVNLRPELFSGVVYAGVPQNCVNVLGPLRNGDDVLLSSRVLTAQVNFTIRTSFALLPLDGKCFIDSETGEEYRIDFFDPKTWDEYRLSPVVQRPLPALEQPTQGTISNLKGSISSVLPSITQRRNSSPKPFKSSASSPSPNSRPTEKTSEQNSDTGNSSTQGPRSQPNAPQLDSLPPPAAENRDPETTPRTAVTIPKPAAMEYLTRILADVKTFKENLAHRPELEEAGAYPPVSIIYGKSIPTVYGAQVKGRDGIKRADAYEDLAFASGDGVVLARAAQLPDGYRAARGGIVTTQKIIVYDTACTQSKGNSVKSDASCSLSRFRALASGAEVEVKATHSSALLCTHIPTDLITSYRVSSTDLHDGSVTLDSCRRIPFSIATAVELLDLRQTGAHSLLLTRSIGLVLAAGITTLLRVFGDGLGLAQGPVTRTLVVGHEEEANNDGDPVHVVANDGTVGGAVGPAEEGVEDAPSASTVQHGIAAVDVPYGLANIVAAGARTRLGGISTSQLVPSVLLQIPDASAKETGGNEVEEAGGDDQEDLEGGNVAKTTLRSGRRAETDTANEDDGLEALTKDSYERQDEHSVLLAPPLESALATLTHSVLGLESLGQLDTPLVLQLGHAQQGSAHERDDDRCNQGKDTLPDVLGGSEVVDSIAVEGANHATANGETNEETYTGAEPHLAYEFLIDDRLPCPKVHMHRAVAGRQQQRLTWDSKDVDHDGCSGRRADVKASWDGEKASKRAQRQRVRPGLPPFGVTFKLAWPAANCPSAVAGRTCRSRSTARDCGGPPLLASTAGVYWLDAGLELDQDDSRLGPASDKRHRLRSGLAPRRPSKRSVLHDRAGRFIFDGQLKLASSCTVVAMGRGLFSTLAGLAAMTSLVAAAPETHTYDFNVTWVTANPDGQFERPTMGINGQWPIPTIKVNVNDTVIINLNNQLGDQSTSLHFHGLYQNGTTHMDGPIGVTQCAVPPGSSITYNFTVNQPGTYWYHSHKRGQYPDGLRGAFLVTDPNAPFTFDSEIPITLSDWYHDQMPGLIEKFINVENPTGAEPVPDAALMDDRQGAQFSVEPGKTYFLRIINMAAFAAQYFWIEGHTMQIVEVDGIYTQPSEASMLYITAAQRYGVLVTARNDTGANFPIVGSMDTDLFDTIPDGLNANVTSYLVYDSAKDMPEAALVDEFDPFDDFTLVPQDEMELYDHYDHQVVLDLKMDNLGDGANYAFFNDVTYVRPKVPTLYSVLSSGDMATDVNIYGVNSNAFVLGHNEIVEIVLNNDDAGKHPFHLHGHAFQVAVRSDEEAGFYDESNTTFSQTPMRRDTLMVRPNGHFVIRFRSDNPGVWLFHCHIEWHVDSGLIATMVEAPLQVQQNLSIPQDHWDVCTAAGTPTKGNAAGNTEDLLDLTGANVSPAPLPEGFTARGIVALVFSIISAFLGLAVISWSMETPRHTYAQRAALASTPPLADYLFRLMEHKQTNLCLAADLPEGVTTAELVTLAEECGDSIAVLKFRSDAVWDLSAETVHTLTQISKRKKFLLFDDRLFGGSSPSIAAQYAATPLHPGSWTSLTSAHLLHGTGVVTSLRDAAIDLLSNLQAEESSSAQSPHIRKHSASYFPSVSAHAPNGDLLEDADAEMHKYPPNLDENKINDELAMRPNLASRLSAASSKNSQIPTSDRDHHRRRSSARSQRPSRPLSSSDSPFDRRKSSVVSINTTISSSTEYIGSPPPPESRFAHIPGITTSASSPGLTPETEVDASELVLPLSRGILLNTDIDYSFFAQTSIVGAYQADSWSQGYKRGCMRVARVYRDFVLGVTSDGAAVAAGGKSEYERHEAGESFLNFVSGCRFADDAGSLASEKQKTRRKAARTEDSSEDEDEDEDDLDGSGTEDDAPSAAGRATASSAEAPRTDPASFIQQQSADVLIVGPPIMQAFDKRAAVERYREAGWRAYLEHTRPGPRSNSAEIPAVCFGEEP